MKKRIKEITEHPVAQHTLRSLKPEKSLWGILGVVFSLLPQKLSPIFLVRRLLFMQKSRLWYLHHG